MWKSGKRNIENQSKISQKKACLMQSGKLERMHLIFLKYKRVIAMNYYLIILSKWIIVSNSMFSKQKLNGVPSFWNNNIKLWCIWDWTKLLNNMVDVHIGHWTHWYKSVMSGRITMFAWNLKALERTERERPIILAVWHQFHVEK